MSLVLAVFATACQQPDGQLFRTTLPTSVYRPLPVVLRDETGLVTTIEPAALDKPTFGDPLVLTDPSDPDAWTYQTRMVTRGTTGRTDLPWEYVGNGAELDVGLPGRTELRRPARVPGRADHREGPRTIASETRR